MFKQYSGAIGVKSHALLGTIATPVLASNKQACCDGDGQDFISDEEPEQPLARPLVLSGGLSDGPAFRPAPMMPGPGGVCG